MFFLPLKNLVEVSSAKTNKQTNKLNVRKYQFQASSYRVVVSIKVVSGMKITC
jgi:hypothetical protein